MRLCSNPEFVVMHKIEHFYRSTTAQRFMSLYHYFSWLNSDGRFYVKRCAKERILLGQIKGQGGSGSLRPH